MLVVCDLQLPQRGPSEATLPTVGVIATGVHRPLRCLNLLCHVVPRRRR